MQLRLDLGLSDRRHRAAQCDGEGCPPKVLSRTNARYDQGRQLDFVYTKRKCARCDDLISQVECRDKAKHQLNIMFWDNSISGLAVAAQAVKRNVQLPKSIYDDEYRRLINAIREARISAGLTQQEIAERLRRPQSYIAKVEGCERRLDVIEFVHLCRGIGVEPMSILETILLPKTVN